LVIIASDRPNAIRRNKEFANNILNCQVIARGIDTEYVYKPGGDEHGPQGDSIHSVADIELLSRSHFFIGSPGSTYSTLIASLVSSSPNPKRMKMNNDKDSQLPYTVTGLLNDKKAEVTLYIGDTLWLPSGLPKDSSDIEAEVLLDSHSNTIRGVLSIVSNTTTTTVSPYLDQLQLHWKCDQLVHSGVASLISNYEASLHDRMYEQYLDWIVVAGSLGFLILICMIVCGIYLCVKRRYMILFTSMVNRRH